MEKEKNKYQSVWATDEEMRNSKVAVPLAMMIYRIILIPYYIVASPFYLIGWIINKLSKK